MISYMKKTFSYAVVVCNMQKAIINDAWNIYI